MPKKLERCIKAVKSQNRKRKTSYNPYAVCKSSIYKKEKEIEIELKIPKIHNSYFNKVQLKKGTEIEKEHTSNKKIAEIIAKQHLLENPNYYKEVKTKNGVEKLVTVRKKRVVKADSEIQKL